NPQEAEARIGMRYQVFLVLWIAMSVSVIIFLIIALVVPGSAAPNQTLTFALLSVSVTTIVASLAIKHKLIKQAIEKQQLQPLMSAYILGLALCESAALFGLLDHFVTGSGFYRFTFILVAMGMLLHFPRKEHLRAVSYKRS